MKKYLNEFKESVIQEYLNTPLKQRCAKNLSEKYDIPSTTLLSWIKKKNITIYNKSHQTAVDETVFDSIDTEEKAYWLGFIYADGCIHSNNRIEVSLSSKDFNHIKKYAKFLGDEGYAKLTHHNTKCRVVFRSKHVYNVLNSYGCSPKKSLTVLFPKESIFKHKCLIKDFIRGYVDGDGCLSTPYFKANKKAYACLNCVGTKEFLTTLLTYLPTSKQIKLNLQHKNSPVNCYNFFIWKDVIPVITYLYEDSKIYLDRKYNKYKEICRLHE